MHKGLFVRCRSVASCGLLALLVLLPTGLAAAQSSESRKIADGMEPAWSPDGRWILISVLTGEQRDLVVVRPDGSERRQITDTPGSELLATWSRDGHVAFVSPADGGLRLFVMEHPLQGDVPPSQLDLPGFTPAFTRAAWTPDGTALTVVVGEYPELDIYRVPLDGASPTPLVTGPGYDGWPAWSVDGRLAFVSDRDGSRGIWVQHPDGTLRRVTTGAARDDQPAWSPDGRWIAFVSDRTGNRQVHVVPSEGGSVVQVTEDEAGSNYPAWSPDGSTLAYTLATRGRGNDQLMIAAAPEQVTGHRSRPGASSSPEPEEVRFRSGGLSVEGAALQEALTLQVLAEGYVEGVVEWQMYETALRAALTGPGADVARGFPSAPDAWQWAFFRRVLNYDPIPYWSKVRQPVLVLYGEDDHNAPAVRSAYRLLRVWRDMDHTDATLRVIPGTGHGLWEPAADPHRPVLHPGAVTILGEWLATRTRSGNR